MTRASRSWLCRRASSACLRSVMSETRPSYITNRPCSSLRGTTVFRIQRTVPSLRTMRCSSAGDDSPRRICSARARHRRTIFAINHPEPEIRVGLELARRKTGDGFTARPVRGRQSPALVHGDGKDVIGHGGEQSLISALALLDGLVATLHKKGSVHLVARQRNASGQPQSSEAGRLRKYGERR